MNTNIEWEYKDFIGLYKNVYPEGYCQHLISEFERLLESGAGYSRQQGEGCHRHMKDDMQLIMNLKNYSTNFFNDYHVSDLFFSGLQKCYDMYIENYSVLKGSRIRSSIMKLQKTSPGGGYHIWHGEQNCNLPYDNSANRVLVYMLYLNSLTTEEAGETEFLYQKLRIRPEENLMVIWPAAYTHAHRGNVVHGLNDKYIVTGWFYYD